MRVLHVQSQLPDRTGSGVYLQSLVREGARRGHDQRVLAAANLDQEVELPWIPEERLSLVRFGGPELPFRLPGMSDVMPYPSSRYSRLDDEQVAQYEAAWGAALRGVRDIWAPDIVHTNHLWLVSALARRIFDGVPMVTSCHGTELRQLDLAPNLAGRVLPAAREVDRVLALTPPQKEQLLRRFGLDPGRVVVMGGAVNTDLFAPTMATRSGEFERVTAARKLEIPSRGQRVLYVGKLSQAKGVSSLLDAVERLGDRSGDYRLLLVGGGEDPEADAIRARARAMAPRVQLLGQLTQATLADLMRSCHLLVLPSFFEGLPLVMLEALVSGCRVVVTDLPSIQGWPAGGLVGEGALERVSLPPMRGVDEPEPEGLEPFAQRLADAMALQLERARLRPAEVGGPVLALEFGWQGLFRRVESIYEELAGGTS